MTRVNDTCHHTSDCIPFKMRCSASFLFPYTWTWSSDFRAQSGVVIKIEIPSHSAIGAILKRAANNLIPLYRKYEILLAQCLWDSQLSAFLESASQPRLKQSFRCIHKSYSINATQTATFMLPRLSG